MTLSKRLTTTIKAFAIFLAIAMAAMLCSGCASAPLGQDAETFKKAFTTDKIAQNGIASNAFVNESPYEVTSFEAEDIEEVTENTVTANIMATLENANFITELNVQGEYKVVNPKKPENGTYTFKVLSSSTTPKKGIDFDTSNGLKDVEAVMSDDGKTCTVTVDSDFDAWFVVSQEQVTYTYEFSDKSWHLSDTDKQREVTYRDIDGKYKAISGNLTRFSTFEISDLDPQNGSFTITYSFDSKDSSIATYSGANGTMQATIEPVISSGDGSMADGYMYRFEASGTSDAGSGQASITGYLTSSSSNEKIIEIVNGTISETHTPNSSALPSGDWPRSLEAGKMYKQ